MCLAQRGGVRRKGKQCNYVRNCVSEMGNNLWVHKYKAFGKLKETAQRKYWSEIFAAYQAVYAAASEDASTPAQQERVEQLVAQTDAAGTPSHAPTPPAARRRPRRSPLTT